MIPDTLTPRRIGCDAAEAEIALPADHPAFAGHFPGQPILPGVAQLDWAITLATRAFRLPPQPAQHVQVKFTRLVTPGQTLTLRLDRAGDTIRFAYRVGDAVASSGRFRFGP